MRVLVDSLEWVIEGAVIGGRAARLRSGLFDLESECTVRCDDGVCFTDHFWLVDVGIVNEPAARVI